MTSQVLKCPLCSQPFQVLQQHAGQVMRCPSCQKQVSIPTDLFGDPTGTAPEESSLESRKQESIVFACPSCAGQFSVLEDMLGNQVGCPHCHTTVLARRPGQQQDPADDANGDEEDLADMFAPGYSPPIDTSPKKVASRGPVDKSRQRPKPGPSAGKQRSPGKATAKTKPADGVPSGATKPEDSNIDAGPATPDLPGTAAAVSAAGVSQIVEDEETTVAPVVWQPRDVSHLLPPRFDVDDPERAGIVRRDTGDRAVMLPDGQGGVQTIDDRIVTMQHDGESIQLVSLSPAVRKRKRLIQNVIAVIVLMAILVLAFIFLRKSV